jgi:hypothetical protein
LKSIQKVVVSLYRLLTLPGSTITVFWRLGVNLSRRIAFGCIFVGLLEVRIPLIDELIVLLSESLEVIGLRFSTLIFSGWLLRYLRGIDIQNICLGLDMFNFAECF